jgi:hypothetical protein
VIVMQGSHLGSSSGQKADVHKFYTEDPNLLGAGPPDARDFCIPGVTCCKIQCVVIPECLWGH